MDGQGTVQDVTAEASASEDKGVETETSPEEEPVGSRRPEPRPIRKLNAADFKIRPEPKPEPKPAPEPEPVVQAVPTEQRPEPKPAPEPPQQPVQPRPEPRPEPKPEPVEAPQQKVEPEPIAEPIPAPVEEPVRASNAYEPDVPKEPVHNDTMAGVPQGSEPADDKKKAPKAKSASTGGIMDAIKGSISFFTIFKMNVGEGEINAMNKTLYIIPFAGLIIGILASIVGLIFSEIGAVAMAPVAVIAFVYIISKFLHLDGLVDFGDGVVVTGDEETRVRALKDTRIGAGGLGIALVTVLAIYAGLSGVWTGFAVAAVIVIMEVFAKNAMVVAAAFGEPGNGMASEQVRNAGTHTMVMSTIVSVALAFAGYLVMGIITSIFVNGMLNSVLIISALLLIAGAALMSIFIGWLMARIANQKFGFVNGDVLGATNEVSKVLVLLVAVIIMVNYTASNLTFAIGF